MGKSSVITPTFTAASASSRAIYAATSIEAGTLKLWSFEVNGAVNETKPLQDQGPVDLPLASSSMTLAHLFLFGDNSPLHLLFTNGDLYSFDQSTQTMTIVDNLLTKAGSAQYTSGKVTQGVAYDTDTQTLVAIVLDSSSANPAAATFKLSSSFSSSSSNANANVASTVDSVSLVALKPDSQEVRKLPMETFTNALYLVSVFLLLFEVV